MKKTYQKWGGAGWKNGSCVTTPEGKEESSESSMPRHGVGLIMREKLGLSQFVMQKGGRLSVRAVTWFRRHGGDGSRPTWLRKRSEG